MDLFTIKKLVAPLFYPVPFFMLLALAGLTVSWFTRRRKTGLLLISLGWLGLFVMATPCIPGYLIHVHETTYPPLAAQLEANPKPIQADINYIVVLGGGYGEDNQVPVS